MSVAKKRNARIKYLKNSISENLELVGTPDTMLYIIIISLVIFGIMSVFTASASEGSEIYNNSAYFLIKHVLAVILGFIVLKVTSRIDFKKWKAWAKPIAIVVILLTAATLIPGLGRTDYGSSRWLAWLPIQPSELAKIATIMLVSSAIVDSKSLFTRKMATHLIMIIVMIVIVLKQPNLSSAVILTMVTVSLLLAGGVSFRLIGGFGASVFGLILSFGYERFMHGYQLKRIMGWLDPWSDPQGIGYNIIQSLYAIGSGGLFGVGYGMSRQKLFWLPFGYTDFIFAVISEELGLIGCIILIGLFTAFIYRGFFIASKCANHFGKLVAFGITFVIGFQAFTNMAVATGVFPVTGVTLPLISHGGTSVVITMAMLGILLNISRKRIKKVQPNEVTNA